MIKIAITGSNGLLGQTLVNLLLKEKDTYQVFGLSRATNRSGRTDFSFISVDLTAKNELEKHLQIIKPDVIVNTAAMTQVDDCEIHQKECDQLNIDLVAHLIEYANKNNTHIIQLSTDFIFDGKKGFYTEADTPNPLSYYGLSKLKSEQLLTSSKIPYTILRTILVYGKVSNMSRSNIVLWVKEMIENQQEITIVNDQYRMPTYVEDLAMACKIAADKKAFGIYHISSNTLLSVFEIAQQIATTFQLDKSLIKPISSSTLNQKALRPPKTGFDLTKTKKELNFYPKSFEEDLKRFKEILTQK